MHSARNRLSHVSSDIQPDFAIVLLVAIACSSPPEGHVNWTLHLLADKVVEMEFAGSISLETVRQILKKTNSSRGGKRNGASPS